MRVITVVALAGASLLAVTAAPAGAVTVSDEAALREAFSDTTVTEIVLAADITLADCGEGSLQRTVLGPPLPLLVLEGAGFAITQTCDFRVMQTEGDLTLSNVTITGGNAISSSGGGVLLGDDGSPSLVVRNSLITGNHATGGGSGGGIDGQTVGTILIEDSTISGNTAGDTGGALRSFGESVTVVRSTIEGNQAVSGGGIDLAQGGPLTMVNSTVVGNQASEGGGGIFADDATIVYSTITQNVAPLGANVVATSDDAEEVVTLFGTVLAQPVGAPNCFVLNPSSVESQGYNFADDASCALDAPTDLPSAGDPQLGALAANGGPTPTRLPADTSPLVGAIPDVACQDASAAGVNTDQRGVARPQPDGCDIGAVEAVPMVPEPVVVAPRFTG